MQNQKKIVFSTPYFSIDEMPPSLQSNSSPFYRYSSCDGVLACLLDSSGHFLLVKQFRQNLDSFTFEFPAGGVDAGETPLDAIRREVKEEVGVSASFVPLGKLHLMINRSDNNDYLFFGFNLNHIQQFKVENYSRPVLILRNDFKKMVSDNKFLQIAGLGVLQLASVVLDIDIFNDSVRNIYAAAEKKLQA